MRLAAEIAPRSEFKYARPRMRALFVLLAAPLLLAACGSTFSCPTTTPTEGSSCSQRAFSCETGGSGNHQRCSTISTCTNAVSASWDNVKDAMCTAKNDAVCATDFNSTPVGGDCTTQGLSCDYGEGRCECLPCGPSGLNWRCRAWSAGLDTDCPSERPALGSDCSMPNLVCRYDDKCSVSLGPDTQCLHERWQKASGGAPACSLPTCGI